MPATKTDKDQLRDAQEIIRRKNLELLDLRKENKALFQQGINLQQVRDEYFGLAGYDFSVPHWVMNLGGPTGKRGGPVLMLSDWHVGEKVNPAELGYSNKFNKTVAAERAKRLTETTIDLCFNHMGRAKTQYPGIVVPLNGDFVSGENHEEFIATNDLTVMDASELAIDLLAATIDNLAVKFGRVFAPCEPGNHGRTTKKPRFKQYVQTNHDYAIYCRLAKHFRGSKHVRFLITPDADVRFDVYGMAFLQTHGDNIGGRGGDGIIGAIGPLVRGYTKLMRQYAAQGDEFDHLIVGHYHQYIPLTFLTCNNAFKGYDEFAKLALRTAPTPASQALLFVHPEHGITARWEVFLQGRKQAAESKVWVKWPQNKWTV